MSFTTSLPDNKDHIWKKVFIAISIAILIIMPLLSKDYGQSGDEWLEIEYGRDIYNYFFAGDNQALDYSNKSLQYQGMELYGGFTDYYSEVLHRMFPSVPILHAKHFFYAIEGALMMIFTGLLAFRLSRKWSVGTVALLFIIFSPRLFGESMNNPKDIPHALGYAMAMYGLIALLQDFPHKLWKHALILAIGFGITFGQRPAGGLLQACYIVMFIGLYYLLNKEFAAQLKADNSKLMKRLVLLVGGALLVGFAIGFSAWPFGLQSPVSNALISLKGMTNRDIVLRVLFDGEYGYNNNMPWYYEFKWICITNPLVVLAGVVLFLALVFRAIKEYGMFTVLFLLFCSFFPLLYMIYKKSSVHDTWRHVFFVYVFWAIMAALGWNLLTTLFKEVKYRQLVPVIAILGLIPTIAWTFRSHPNQYVYFNELQGGVKGAFGNYDLDYYQNSGKQAADWIRANVKPIPGRKVQVGSNMGGFDKYFAKDTAWIRSEYVRFPSRHEQVWDYYITYGRFISAEQLQGGHWPPDNVIHAIAIDGAVLSAIIQRKSNASIDAHKAMEAKDFATAVSKYEEYLKTDKSDDNVWLDYGISLASIGRMNEAISAINNAVKIDPSRPEVYQVLSQIYQAIGNTQAANDAMMSAQSLMMAEQEKQKPQEEE
ncbi:MAG: tetratricopeptide repeat protein [Sphingobacteriales bacterium]|nr:MAG: tetratricopeptide repeat protein [Sphingobacteriales bacterium]